MLDCRFRLAANDPYPATRPPRACEIRIEREGAIDKSNGIIEIAQHRSIGECMRSLRERDRVIGTELRRAPGQTRSFCGFLGSIGRPSVELAPDVAPCRHTVGRRELAITFHSGVKQPQRLVDCLAAALVKARHAAQKIFVSVETLGGLALGAFDFGMLYLGR